MTTYKEAYDGFHIYNCRDWGGPDLYIGQERPEGIVLSFGWYRDEDEDEGWEALWAVAVLRPTKERDRPGPHICGNYSLFLINRAGERIGESRHHLNLVAAMQDFANTYGMDI
jgi:hypothetical protein